MYLVLWHNESNESWEEWDSFETLKEAKHQCDWYVDQHKNDSDAKDYTKDKFKVVQEIMDEDMEAQKSLYILCDYNCDNPVDGAPVLKLTEQEAKIISWLIEHGWMDDGIDLAHVRDEQIVEF